jgi:transposase
MADRQMIEEMLYVLRVACPWRYLPEHFGPWSSVYTRWRRWNRGGLWAHLLKVVAENLEGILVHLEATHVKAHQDGTNPRGGQELQAVGRTRGGLNTKVTAMANRQQGRECAATEEAASSPNNSSRKPTPASRNSSIRLLRGMVGGKCDCPQIQQQRPGCHRAKDQPSRW